MWKQFSFSKNFSIILLLLASLSILASLYYLFSVPKLPVFSATLLLAGVSFALVFSIHQLFPVFTGMLILSFLLSSYSFAPIPEKVLSNLNFFIQWFFFWWAFEIGQNLKKSNKPLKKIFIAILLNICLFSLFYLFKQNYLSALTLSCLFSLPAYFSQPKNIKKDIIQFVFFSLLFLFCLISLSPSYYYGIKLLCLFLFLFISLEVYHLFLRGRVKFLPYLFFLSFLIALISYTIFPVPIFICGLFAGNFFSEEPYYLGEKRQRNYIKILFTAVILSQIRFSYDLLYIIPIALVIFAFEIFTLYNSDNLKSNWVFPSLEFPLSLISIPFLWKDLGLGQSIISVLWIVFVLNAVLEILKPKKFHFLSRSQEK